MGILSGQKSGYVFTLTKMSFGYILEQNIVAERVYDFIGSFPKKYSQIKISKLVSVFPFPHRDDCPVCVPASFDFFVLVSPPLPAHNLLKPSLLSQMLELDQWIKLLEN